MAKMCKKNKEENCYYCYDFFLQIMIFCFTFDPFCDTITFPYWGLFGCDLVLNIIESLLKLLLK